jgi:hypothetical protein
MQNTCRARENADTGKTICKEFTNKNANTKANRTLWETEWQLKGFLFAFADSTAPLKACLKTGRFIDSFYLIHTLGAKKDTFLTKAGDLNNLVEAELRNYQNQGYPFVFCKIVPFYEGKNTIIFELKTEPENYYLLDSVLTDRMQLNPALFYRAARVKTKQPYNESALQLLIARLGVLEGFKPLGTKPILSIYNQKLIAQLPILKTARDQFSGLLGLATNADGRVLLTGEVAGRFYNLFRSGTYSNFEWRSFKARSQEMHIDMGLPYLFGLPFVSQFAFGIEKYDTLYSILRAGIRFRFPISSQSAFVLGYDRINRTRIFADENWVRAFHQLPDNPSSVSQSFHLGFESHTVYPGDLPHAGYFISINANAGIREYVEDARIAGIYWPNKAGIRENVFDSLKRTGKFKSPQIRYEYNLAQYIPVFDFLVLKLGAQGFQYIAPVVYFNELNRIGGIKSIRGFNEQSIFASTMHSASAELRVMLGNSGYFGPFYNVGYYENKSRLAQQGHDVLQGIGIASGIRTAAGILQIIWALGSSSQQPFAFNNSKFHFGISSSF